MTDTIKQVRVDNWGQFFLSKLQSLYTRGDYCDVTLQFHTNESIKVHRLVLNSCTDYFENLLKYNATDHMRLPPSLNSDVVVPIINFMYSGVLEFRPELTTRLYNTAKFLKMSVLTTLLDNHAGPIAQPRTPLQAPNVEPTVVSVVTSQSSTSTSGSSTRRVGSPPPNFPLTAEHATAAALLQKPHSPSPAEHIEATQPPKKLSIWKKRSSHNTSHTNSFVTVIPQKPVVDEPAKPTRFEWPDDECEAMPLLYSSTFDDISYDSVPIVKSINNIVKSRVTTQSHGLVVMPQQKVMPVATFESVYQSASLKRPATSPSQSLLRTPKKAKVVDINDVKELMQEQEVRKGLMAQETEADDLEDFLPEARNDDDDDECDAEELSTSSTLVRGQQRQSSQDRPPSQNASAKKGTPKPILKVSEVTSPEVNVSKEQLNASGSSKKVRFSLENQVHTLTTTSDGKQVRVLSSDGTSLYGSSINSSGPKSSVPTNASNTLQNQPTNVDGATETHVLSTSKSPGDGVTQQVTIPKASTNHAKIIAEISYMVVKAESCIKTEEEQTSETQKPAVTPSGAENTKGPWLCETCGTKESPLNFETYYTYRKHLQDVHNEKFDVRICEHCGYKANKRNLLLYHLLTKHGVPPPSNCTFPKCEQCDHYALSETLLVKHRNTHSADKEKEFACKVCSASFKTATALQGHIQMKSHWPESNKKAFKCPVCHKSFSSHNNLSTHVEAFHKDANVPLQEEEAEDDPGEVETSTDEPQSQTYVQQCPEEQEQHLSLPVHQEQHHETHHVAHQAQETHIISHTDQHQEQHATYILPDVSLLAGAQQGTLLQSTEAESLSNVASGIAASLGVSDSMVVVEQPQPQTVLYLDKGQLILQTAGGSVHGLPPNTHVQEYIVPEIMASDMAQGVGVYTAGQLSQIVQYATGAVAPGEQSILTIVNPNGAIVNQTPTIVQQHEILQHVPVAHQETSVENMAVVISDHDYAEEVALQPNGHGTQDVVVPENGTTAVSQLPMVVSVPAADDDIPRTEQSEFEIPKLVRETESELVNAKVECGDEESSNPPPVLERESPVPMESSDDAQNVDDSQVVDVTSNPQSSSVENKAETSEKMAALVRDWDDFEDDNAGQVNVNCQPVTEEALPSRPTILLRSDMDHDDLSGNLVKIT